MLLLINMNLLHLIVLPALRKNPQKIFLLLLIYTIVFQTLLVFYNFLLLCFVYTDHISSFWIFSATHAFTRDLLFGIISVYSVAKAKTFKCLCNTLFYYNVYYTFCKVWKLDQIKTLGNFVKQHRVRLEVTWAVRLVFYAMNCEQLFYLLGYVTENAENDCENPFLANFHAWIFATLPLQQFPDEKLLQVAP